MSETELREGLLGTILAGVEHNGIPHPRHSDACHLADAKIVRAAFASFNALASTYGHRPIPAEPEQADEVAGLRNVERLMAYLWNAELPITAAMRAQKAIGDTMTVRDVFNHGNPDDPLVTDVDLALAPSALADLRDDAPARDDTSGGAS